MKGEIKGKNKNQRPSGFFLGLPRPSPALLLGRLASGGVWGKIVLREKSPDNPQSLNNSPFELSFLDPPAAPAAGQRSRQPSVLTAGVSYQPIPRIATDPMGGDLTCEEMAEVLSLSGWHRLQTRLARPDGSLHFRCHRRTDSYRQLWMWQTFVMTQCQIHAQETSHVLRLPPRSASRLFRCSLASSQSTQRARPRLYPGAPFLTRPSRHHLRSDSPAVSF